MQSDASQILERDMVKNPDPKRENKDHVVALLYVTRPGPNNHTVQTFGADVPQSSPMSLVLVARKVFVAMNETILHCSLKNESEKRGK